MVWIGCQRRLFSLFFFVLLLNFLFLVDSQVMMRYCSSLSVRAYNETARAHHNDDSILTRPSAPCGRPTPSTCQSGQQNASITPAGLAVYGKSLVRVLSFMRSARANDDSIVSFFFSFLPV